MASDRRCRAAFLVAVLMTTTIVIGRVSGQHKTLSALCQPSDPICISKNSFNGSRGSSSRDPTVLPLGEAFNIFHSYGFLAFSIHVSPITSSAHQPPTNSSSSSNDTSLPAHLFQLVTHPVLDSKHFQPDIRRYHNKPTRSGQVDKLVHLQLCDRVEDLKAAFFRNFHVDGLNKPWKAFTASWKKQFLPKIYGVPAAFLTDDFTFVLIRIEKCTVAGSINGSMLLESDLLAKLAGSVTNSESDSDVSGGSSSTHHQHTWRPAIDFFLQYGTHMVNNYTAGDALYQVLVYNSSAFVNHVDLRGRLDRFKPANASRTSWIELFSNPAPVHIGKLQLLSGNRTLITWLESRLAVSPLPKTLPSSIRLLSAPVLFNLFYRQLQTKAVLSMDLISLDQAVPEDIQRSYGLGDILLNLLRMWEYNM